MIGDATRLSSVPLPRGLRILSLQLLTIALLGITNKATVVTTYGIVMVSGDRICGLLIIELFCVLGFWFWMGVESSRSPV
jgi:hypothetical protein